MHDLDQLYDIENDPGEQKNLAYEAEYQTVLNEMKLLLKEHLTDRPGIFGEFDQYQYTTECRYENMAIGKTAAQSSTHYADKGFASAAVDGETDDVGGQYTFSCTKESKWAWWQVDLGKVEFIDRVNIWNRVDAASRLKNFVVFTSKTPFVTDDPYDYLNNDDVYSYSFESQSERPTSINVEDSGRYVRVQLWDDQMLHMTEVEVLKKTSSSKVPKPLPKYEVDALDTVWLDGSLWQPLQDSANYNWALEDSIYKVINENSELAMVLTTLENSNDSTRVKLQLSINNEAYHYQMPLYVRPIQASLVANAGADTIVNENALVQLNGTASFVYGNQEITNAKWESKCGSLQNANNLQPTFLAPEVSADSIIVLCLRIASNDLWSKPDSLIVRIKNIPTGMNVQEQQLPGIYPNPVPSGGLVNLNLPKSNDINIKIVDLTGRVVLNECNVSGKQYIKLPSLKQGIYSVEISIEDKSYLKKIIVK